MVQPDWEGIGASVVTNTVDGIEEGPWGVYDCYCLRCSSRAVTVAPVQAEDIDLWECVTCGEMTMTHHLYESDDES